MTGRGEEMIRTVQRRRRRAGCAEEKILKESRANTSAAHTSLLIIM